MSGSTGAYAPTLAEREESREVDLTTAHAERRLHADNRRSDIGVDDLQRGRDENGGPDVEEAIGAALMDGPRPSREVKAQIAPNSGAASEPLSARPNGRPRRATCDRAPAGSRGRRRGHLPVATANPCTVATTTNGQSRHPRTPGVSLLPVATS